MKNIKATVKTNNKATVKTNNKATKQAVKVIKEAKQPLVKTSQEVEAIALATAKINGESQTREQARVALFEVIASLATLVHTLPKSEKLGKTSELRTQYVNKYIFKNVFGFNDTTPSDETRVARGKIQVAKAIYEDKQENLDCLENVTEVFEVLKSYCSNNFATYKEMVEFSKDDKAPKSPKSENEKLLTSWNTLKTLLDNALEENDELANAFISQAVDFLNAKTSTNKAKKSLNYKTQKVA